MGLLKTLRNWWNDPGDPCPFCDWVDAAPCRRHTLESMNRTPYGWYCYGTAVTFVKEPGQRVIDAYSDTGFVAESYINRQQVTLNMQFYSLEEATTKAESYLERKLTEDERNRLNVANQRAEEPYE